MSIDELMYKNKYLKYKAKYLELKTLEQQGGLLDSGFAIVFTSTENANKLRDAFAKGSIGSKGSIADLLDKQAYIVFDNKKPAELMESTSRIFKDNVYAASAVASKAVTTATNSAIAAASSATNTVVNQYNKYQEDSARKAAEKAAEKAEFDKFKTQQSNNASPVVTSNKNPVTNSNVKPVTNSNVNPSANSNVNPSVNSNKNPVTNYNNNPVVTSNVDPNELDLVGGDGLPKTLKTFENKTFDRANENHKEFIRNAVAVALGLDPRNIDMVVIKFKMFGKPELR